ncbi:MAG TPA: CDP-diacylglycerol--glycerol-3-phosphate 3-phosphatidyltransferase [Candidatus Acidoferrum sp.]|nr:CDP-diacylglycerol--glycerol-3-phosphate 3-phosphatidyltransferase [Candidatus Acidoferrum sp.]
MNTPNKLTLLRIVLAPVFMILFVTDNYYLRMSALVLFVIAALTDLADGFIARKYNVITGFGKFMDPLADKILVSSALVSFVSLHYVSPLPAVLIIGREFSITGLRLLAAYRGVIIPPTWWAKVKTFLQLSAVGVVMGYISLIDTLSYFRSGLLPFFQFDYLFWFNMLLWLTAAVTIWTGIDYVVKYFYMIKSVLK